MQGGGATSRAKVKNASNELGGDLPKKRFERVLDVHLPENRPWGLEKGVGACSLVAKKRPQGQLRSEEANDANHVVE